MGTWLCGCSGYLQLIGLGPGCWLKPIAVRLLGSEDDILQCSQDNLYWLAATKRIITLPFSIPTHSTAGGCLPCLLWASLGSLKKQKTCLKPKCVMGRGAEGRRGTWSLLFRDTFVSGHFSCTGRLPGVTGTKWTEAITSRYSSSSSSSSLNYFSLFPLSANLQNCAHWTTYVWLCLNPVLQDNLDFKDLGWTVCSESALKGRMGQHLQGVGARRKQTPRAWLCF